MKTVQNKKVKIESKGEVKESVEKTYGELIFIACNRSDNPTGTFTYEDLKKVKRIDDAVSNKKEGEDICFEDADFENVKNKVKTMGWGFYSPEIIEFVEYIDTLK